LLAHGQWFSQGTPVSSITTTGLHDIAEILLKVALKHQKSINHVYYKTMLSIVLIVHLDELIRFQDCSDYSCYWEK
jgi:hypothetical protein